ncbi:helicase-associated domain-containing protein [Microbacterium terrisoli]|uniref:helicase-associated domain-containing protein n=1 Tax=Microbacterium terrisoli TaxID=3242192 RepID=UPI002804EF63|nr:helicase-associated domain-containing protein [Microbacterium protaetiae]
MTATSDARALATLLAGSDPQGLARLLHARGVTAAVPWRDCFDAAEALLEPASVDRALATLARAAVSAMDAAAAADSPVESGQREAVAALGLVRADGQVFDAVAERLRALLALTDATAADAVTTADVSTPADQATAAELAERVAAATRTLTDLVARAADQPLTVTGTGSVTAIDRRRLIDAHVVADTAELDDLLALADDSGLLALADREWVPTTIAERWLPSPLAQRWSAVAIGWRDRLPDALRTPAGGFAPPAQWHGAIPLDPTWPVRADQILARAARWGLYGTGGAEPAWTTPLRAGQAPDLAALARLMPAEIDRIYLQADLTAIAPGPLRSALDLRLRTMAIRETAAQASTYRFTASSLAAAVAAGEDARSLHDFLTELSLTGIPQPLAYLIEQTAARHGLVRVGIDADTQRTRVTSTDEGLLRTIAVDQALRAIGLVDAGDALTSRVGRDAVFWTLADARYPVLAVDAAGNAEPVQRRRAPVAVAPDLDPAAALVPLAEALLAHSTADADAAWLTRELDHAVRTHADVLITVQMPDGSRREFTLEATGLGGGRLRGRDRAGDVERTIPVASIVSVRPS